MATTNTNNMSIEELEAHIFAINEQIQDLRQRAIEAHAVLDKKNSEESALRKLDQLSESEMEALAQHVGVNGIAKHPDGN